MDGGLALLTGEFTIGIVALVMWLFTSFLLQQDFTLVLGWAIGAGTTLALAFGVSASVRLWFVRDEPDLTP
jgi:hypothetical protein